MASTVTPHRKGETVAPTNTRALIAGIGVTRASRLLGVSTTTLHKARKNTVVSKVIEVGAEAAMKAFAANAGNLAAQGIVITHNGVKDTQLLLIEATPEKCELLGRVAKLLGAETVSA